MDKMKVALIHDWLIRQRGGEKVLEHIARLYPESDIYTLFCDRKKISPYLASRNIKTSWLQYVPGIGKVYPFLLPFFPWTIRLFNLKKYDLIISSSHCVAKGIVKPKEALHLCYCHTPIRYAWKFQKEYFKGKIYGFLAIWILSWLKRWDYATAQEVDYYCANSFEVKKRIENYYQRDAEVIHPPVDLNSEDSILEDRPFYLVLSALVPYKRIDLAVEAFNDLGYELKVIGTGPCLNELKQSSKTNIEFLGWVEDSVLKSYYANAKAFIFPGLEDFGITPLEAQIMGTPVIAFGEGGVTETVVPYKEDGVFYSGVFFESQDKESILHAVRQFESLTFDRKKIKEHALSFRGEVFDLKLKNWINDKMSQKRDLSLPSG